MGSALALGPVRRQQQATEKMLLQRDGRRISTPIDAKLRGSDICSGVRRIIEKIYYGLRPFEHIVLRDKYERTPLHRQISISTLYPSAIQAVQ